jgi:superfamily II DNA or RNA helicase
LVLAPGSVVHVRQRRWLVENVEKAVSAGEASLVELACIDDDAQGQPLSVLWEHEPDARVLDGEAWADIGAKGFDPPGVFSAYLNTRRWNCVSATDPTVFQAPFRAGIRIDAYQLEPLRKALALPRVNLFIADDVGLGKTIEAGLIARELLLRKRIDTIVVVAPPSMVPQWQDELETRFGLTFAVIDRQFYTDTRRERGYGTNPWATHSRFLISNRLLVDETYAAGLREWLSRDAEIRARSLLILDEAHHAAPSSGAKYAIDSQITRAVRDLAARFEHRLFLSATPHNGHSNSFSALLEILEPNRFVRGVKVRPGDLKAVMVRRLKEDLRQIDGGFPKRTVSEVRIDGLPPAAPELVLAAKLDAYREAREARLAAEPPSIQRQSRLIVTTLQQRLLSSVEAFWRTLSVHRRATEAAAAGRPAVQRDGEVRPVLLAPVVADDDRAGLPEDVVEQATNAAIESASAASSAAGPRRAGMEAELALLREMHELADRHRDDDDAKMGELIAWIRTHMFAAQRGGAGAAAWNGRRLIVFTEWEDTRRYVERRLRAALAATGDLDGRIETFTGSTPSDRRESIKHAFNADPARNPVRILIATDAAREGLNLQRHCHDLFHFDLPWNPSRIEQRNGRIDRKLQPAPEVFCRYFFYAQRPEDKVLQALLRKTARIRDELGALGKVLEDRTEKLMRDGIRRSNAELQAREIDGLDAPALRDAVREEMDDEAEDRRRAALRREIDETRRLLDRSRRQVGVDADQVRNAIDVGLALAGCPPLRLVRPAAGDVAAQYGLVAEGSPLADRGWIPALDMLRERPEQGESLADWRRRAPIRPLVFRDPGELGDGAVQMHLEHRVAQRILGRFSSKGLIDHDLSRACLSVAPDAVPRVVLVGRLSLYGDGGTRLHEELIEVAARWTDPRDRAKKGLQPYGREAERRALETLEAALARPQRAPSGKVLETLKGSTARDVGELTPVLEARAAEAQREAEAKLAQRAEREAAEMLRLLDDQAKRIRERQKRVESEQLELALDKPDERDQLRRDRKAWEARLSRIAIDRVREPDRIRESYAIRAARVEPVGLVYLWPETG